jgi:hypothetical protein
MSPGRADSLAPLAAACGAFAALVLASAVVIECVPVLKARAIDTGLGERPRSADYYLASDIGSYVDHHVLYHGLDDDALAHMRAAEVVFLGNSRLMFALRPDVLRPFFAARGLRYYALGFGFREADRFPLAILRKFDLRPRLVVINADGFFGGGLSAWADVVHRDSVFAARKHRWEAEAAHVARRATHALLPHWGTLVDLPGLGRARAASTYRSRVDGTWDISTWPDGDTIIPPMSDEPVALGRGEVAGALAFKQELDARGSRMLLTRVPTPQPYGSGTPSAFARLLGVPLITVHPPGLATHDVSHLDEGSAHDWARAFVAALDAHLAALDSDGAAVDPSAVAGRPPAPR